MLENIPKSEIHLHTVGGGPAEERSTRMRKI